MGKFRTMRGSLSWQMFDTGCSALSIYLMAICINISLVRSVQPNEIHVIYSLLRIIFAALSSLESNYYLSIKDAVNSTFFVFFLCRCI
jgi:hypothetical protein